MRERVRHIGATLTLSLMLSIGAHATTTALTITPIRMTEALPDTTIITPNIKAISTNSQEVKTTPAPIQSHPFSPNPKRALLYSIIPGGGQIYNRKYWKLPIIIGAYTVCYYAITWNNDNLQEYALAYRDIKSKRPLENKSWVDFIPYGAKPEDYVNNSSFQDQLRRGRDFYRHNRDLSIIASVGVYLLVMLDAYVDAELYNFDISPNVSLSYTPTIIPPSIANPHNGYGMTLALTF